MYSGPAINVLAIVLTTRILGWKLGLARAIGAIVMSVVIGLLMHYIFIKEEKERVIETNDFFVNQNSAERKLWQNTLFFISLVGILVFANWGKPTQMLVKTDNGTIITGTRVLIDEEKIILKVKSGEEIALAKKSISEVSYLNNLYSAIYNLRFYIASLFLLLLLFIIFLWFKKED